MPSKKTTATITRPRQHQNRRPGLESPMRPRPKSETQPHQHANRLLGRVALITGGDSGIGRAVALAMAEEGADIAIIYFDEHNDAKETQRLVEETEHRCLAIAGDIGDEAFCREAIERAVDEFGHL